MTTDDDAVPTTPAGSPRAADRILVHVHGRYRRRKRIQASLSIMTVVIFATASVAAIDNLRSRASGPSIHVEGASGGDVRSTGAPALSCQGRRSASGPSRTTGTSHGSQPLDSRALARTLGSALVKMTTSSGSGQSRNAGVIVSPDGEVVTRNEAIADATTINVDIGGTGKTHTARVVGYDVVDDIALLHIDGVSNLKTVTVGDSSTVKVGDPVVALGFDLASAGEPLKAIPTRVTKVDVPVSAGAPGSASLTLSRTIEVPISTSLLAGVLVNAQGSVVGLNAVENSGANSKDVLFAIPINDTATVIAQICSGTNTDRVHIGSNSALLGVQTQDANSSASASSQTSPVQAGALITTVQSGSAAAAVGIRTGDVITAIDNKPIANSDALRRALVRYVPGERIAVEWIDTAGRRHTATTKLGAGPPS